MNAVRINARTRAEAEQWLLNNIRPGLFILQQAHDDFCPSIRTQRDADCRPPCKPDFYLIPLGEDGRQN